MSMQKTSTSALGPQVTLLTGRALEKHTLVIPVVSVQVLYLANVHLNHARQGSRALPNSETETDLGDIWKSCGTVRWELWKKWMTDSDMVSNRNFRWLCQGNIPWKVESTYCCKDLIENS